MADWPKHYPESLKELRKIWDLQKESRMTFDVKQNNWILPLRGEPVETATPERLMIRDHGMRIRIQWQAPKTFYEMNTISYWMMYFSRYKLSELKRQAGLYGIEIGDIKGTKTAYIEALAEFWQKKMYGVK